MAQTKEGAQLVSAKKAGISIEEFLRLVGEGLKRCTKCQTWQYQSNFGKDRTRHDRLDAKCHRCRCVKVRKNMKGKPSAFKGRSHTVEARLQMSIAAKERGSNRAGKPHTAETKARISQIVRERTPRGTDHYAYKHGNKQRNLDERRSVEYQQWRTAVYERDSYTCQHCSDNKGGNLNAHHIKPFADFPKLRYELSNGLTLCQDCHEKVHLKPIPKAKCRRKKHAMPD